LVRATLPPQTQRDDDEKNPANHSLDLKIADSVESQVPARHPERDPWAEPPEMRPACMLAKKGDSKDVATQ
jgi:hypothetical protein